MSHLHLMQDKTVQSNNSVTQNTAVQLLILPVWGLDVMSYDSDISAFM